MYPNARSIRRSESTTPPLARPYRFSPTCALQLCSLLVFGPWAPLRPRYMHSIYVIHITDTFATLSSRRLPWGVNAVGGTISEAEWKAKPSWDPSNDGGEDAAA